MDGAHLLTLFLRSTLRLPHEASDIPPPPTTHHLPSPFFTACPGITLFALARAFLPSDQCTCMPRPQGRMFVRIPTERPLLPSLAASVREFTQRARTTSGIRTTSPGNGLPLQPL